MHTYILASCEVLELICRIGNNIINFHWKFSNEDRTVNRVSFVSRNDRHHLLSNKEHLFKLEAGSL